jgi:hypothetical protein
LGTKPPWGVGRSAFSLEEIVVMRRVTVTSLGDPGSFTLTDKTDPLYYIARYSHEQSMNLYLLQSNSFAWEQDEDSDISAIQTAWETYLPTFEAWAESAIAASSSGSSIPDIPSLPLIPATTVEGILIQLALKYGLALLAKWLEAKLIGDTEGSEVAQILRRAMLKNAGTPQEFSIFEQLSNVPLELIFSSLGEYKDMFYSDRED